MNAYRPVLLLVFFITAHVLSAQTDAPGCADHPMLERIEGYYIERCSESTRPVMAATGKKKQAEVKGNSTTVSYYGKADHLPNGYYLIKSYERAIKARGGRKLYWDNGNSGNKPAATFRLTEAGREYWITLTNFRGVPTEGVASYDLTVIDAGKADAP